MASFVPPFGVLVRSAALLLAVSAIGGLLTVWSGLYSVAASRGHWPGFELFLEFGMRSSVRTHALGIDVPRLDDADRVRRGSAHFQQGCAPCHGSPAGPSMQVVRSMLPEPSDLRTMAPTWRSNELFWIVKNGLKYTGMPAWPAQQRDDEVWDVVAFLRELPGMAPDRYRALAGLDSDAQPSVEPHSDKLGDRSALLGSCARCHGIDGRGRETTAFPRLDLQREEWLLAQLQAYASGHRASGVMQVAAAELTTQEMMWLAKHYASANGSPNSPATPGLHDGGEALFLRGAPEQGVPACIACHTGNAAARDRAYPALLGQYADYTETQLNLFREGKRNSTEAARLMSTIAARMSAQQVKIVSSYLAAQPSGSGRE